MLENLKMLTINKDRIKKPGLYDNNKDNDISRAVTVADFYHRGGNGQTTAGGAVS